MALDHWIHFAVFASRALDVGLDLLGTLGVCMEWLAETQDAEVFVTLVAECFGVFVLEIKLIPTAGTCEYSCDVCVSLNIPSLLV